MFNKELKEQFIKDDTTNKNFSKFMPNLFESISKYEDEYGKDLSNFNIKEIENYFIGLSTSSYIRLQNVKSQFIKYSRYCQDRGLIDDNQIHWLEADSDFINNVINIGKFRTELVTRKQLLMDLQKLPNPSEQFILLGIFEGVCGNLYSDFYHLDTNQFVRNDNGRIILKLKNKDLYVSEKLYDLAIESAETYENIPHSVESKRTIKLSPEDPWVIKRAVTSTIDTELSNMHNMAKRLAKIRIDYDLPYCTQAGLLNSGRIDYIIQISDKDEILVESIKRNYNIITERYGRIQKIADLLSQYTELYGKEK